MLSPAKPAQQSDEGSKKTPLAALREARLGCSPCGTCTCSQLENPELGHVSLPSSSTFLSKRTLGPVQRSLNPLCNS